MTGMEHAIERVAQRLHSSYCECEGWHTECQGPQEGDRRVARRLAAEGLLSPAPLTEEWGTRFESSEYVHHGTGVEYPFFFKGDPPKGANVRRYVTDWEGA